MSLNMYPIYSEEEELIKQGLCFNINNCEAGCNEALASQKLFLKNVSDRYVPYDYITAMSNKYDKFKKKDNTKLSHVKCEWVINKLDTDRPTSLERLIIKLDFGRAPELEEFEKKILDENWTRWVPVNSSTMDQTTVDRQLENDVEVMSSPYRTTEKSVLTMMLPIKPFPVRTSDDDRWNRFPLNKPMVYAKIKQTNAPLYYSMMHKYYQSGY